MLDSSAVEWYQDGVRLDSGIFMPNSSTLTIQDFRISAVYQCHVTNEHGSDMASVFFCLQRQGGWSLTVLVATSCPVSIVLFLDVVSCT